MQVFENLQNTISAIDVEKIPNDRRALLNQITEYIRNKKSESAEIRLVFICTHNSRRSHLAQVWAQTMAAYFEIEKITCFSAGTEETALFPIVAKTLENQGFVIDQLPHDKNPIYSVKYGENSHPVIGFSKTIAHRFNPISHFCAIMTCDSANESCPFVPGADFRIALSYEDPKQFDNTSFQEQKYLERSVEIATEMYFVFSQIQK